MPVKTYISNRTTQKKYRLNGFKKSTRLPNKPELQQSFSNHMVYSAPQLPPKVDLRSAMTPVEKQEEIGSCVGNSMAGAYEYLLKKTSGRNIDVSRLFIYYNARVKDAGSDSNIQDEGCTVTSAIEALKESGTCLEEIWPYKTKRVNKCPSDEAYDAAQNNTINDALQLKIDLHEMKACLAQGLPFVFGLEIYKSFYKAESNRGIVPMPKPQEKDRDSLGGHAMLAVGYSDRSKAFIIRNSWGSDWGDQGYCYIPYEYMTNEDYCSELWAIRRLDADDIGHENWDEDDEVDYHDDDDDDDGGDDDDDDDVDVEVQDEDDDDDDDDDDE